MKYVILDIRENTQWVLGDDIVTVEGLDPINVYFADGVSCKTEKVSVGYFLENAYLLKESDKEISDILIEEGVWWKI